MTTKLISADPEYKENPKFRENKLQISNVSITLVLFNLMLNPISCGHKIGYSVTSESVDSTTQTTTIKPEIIITTTTKPVNPAYFPCIPRFLGIDFSKKKAVQSSVDNSFDANWAQDGNGATCSRTNGTDQVDKFPWWRIDLVDQYVVTNVTCYTAPNCCQGRNEMQVRVGQFMEEGKGTVFTYNALCAELVASNGSVFTFNCHGMLIGRYITVQKVGQHSECDDEGLSICELAVKGYKLVKQI
uniref:Fucolectin tachylectin-4 pentraxin-1 domain-containing protein n=1 Tax=Strigamia maritima TaxID=126957 RepID=T1J411_STRMM